jgi:CheY-like chemotaxis protein
VPDKGPPPPRILVADDHDLIRRALCDELERGGFAVCAEAATGADALAAALREEPDLCLLDVVMPAGDGPATAVAIKRKLPQTKILLFRGRPRRRPRRGRRLPRQGDRPGSAFAGGRRRPRRRELLPEAAARPTPRRASRGAIVLRDLNDL